MRADSMRRGPWRQRCLVLLFVGYWCAHGHAALQQGATAGLQGAGAEASLPDADLPACVESKVASDNNKGMQTRFFTADLDRTLEVVTDAMRAAGFAPRERKSKTAVASAGARHVSIETDGRNPKLVDTGGGAGGETLEAEFDEAVEDGKPGTRVSIDTKKHFGGRARQHNWSVPVLDEAQCLLAMLDSEPVDKGSSSGPAVSIPDGLPIALRLRRFVSPSIAKEGDTVVFQVSRNVRVNQAIVIVKGAPAQGRIAVAQGAKNFGRNAQLAFAVESVQAIDGSMIPLRADSVQAGGKTNIAFNIAYYRALGFLVKGSDKGVRAGSEVVAFIDGARSVAGTAPRQQ